MSLDYPLAVHLEDFTCYSELCSRFTFDLFPRLCLFSQFTLGGYNAINLLTTLFIMWHNKRQHVLTEDSSFVWVAQPFHKQCSSKQCLPLDAHRCGQTARGPSTLASSLPLLLHSGHLGYGVVALTAMSSAITSAWAPTQTLSKPNRGKENHLKHIHNC